MLPCQDQACMVNWWLDLMVPIKQASSAWFSASNTSSSYVTEKRRQVSYPSPLDSKWKDRVLQAATTALGIPSTRARPSLSPSNCDDQKNVNPTADDSNKQEYPNKRQRIAKDDCSTHRTCQQQPNPGCHPIGLTVQKPVKSSHQHPARAAVKVQRPQWSGGSNSCRQFMRMKIVGKIS